MDHNSLRLTLLKLRIEPSALAAMLSVTTRAVGYWLGGQRPIPGPVEAYVRLLEQIPEQVRQYEISRGKDVAMVRQGMYSIEYEGTAGRGVGALTFEEGLVWGADAGGGKYDGHYRMDPVTGVFEADIIVTVPPGTWLVTGVPAQPKEWQFPIYAKVPKFSEHTRLSINTPFGPVLVVFRFLRDLPVAA